MLYNTSYITLQQKSRKILWLHRTLKVVHREQIKAAACTNIEIHVFSNQVMSSLYVTVLIWKNAYNMPNGHFLTSQISFPYSGAFDTLYPKSVVYGYSRVVGALLHHRPVLRWKPSAGRSSWLWQKKALRSVLHWATEEYTLFEIRSARAD